VDGRDTHGHDDKAMALGSGEGERQIAGNNGPACAKPKRLRFGVGRHGDHLGSPCLPCSLPSLRRDTVRRGRGDPGLRASALHPGYVAAGRSGG
jgi:hypothetical protein